MKKIKKLLFMVASLLVVILPVFTTACASKNVVTEYTINFDYGYVGAGTKSFFENYQENIKMKPYKWMENLPKIKDEYTDAFEGWYIQGTDKKIENYDFIGGNVTLEARWAYLPSGVYEVSGDYTSWDELIESKMIILSVDGTVMYEVKDESFEEEYFVVVDNKVTMFWDEAFWNCSNLIGVEFGSKSNIFPDTMFKKSPKMRIIKVSGENTKFDSRNDCNAVINTETDTLVVACKTTIVPNDVKIIGDYAFCAVSGIKSIVLPKSLTSIGMSAFAGCSDLTEIIYKGTAEEWENIEIDESNKSLLNGSIVVKFEPEND